MTAESLWLPRSHCDTACLPPPAAVPWAGPLRSAWRWVAVAVTLAAAMASLPVLVILPAVVRVRGGRLFARLLLRGLGVTCQTRGSMPRGQALVVGNHVSWLDVLVLMALLPVRPVAKREVRRWPVIGMLAVAVGALFIDRSRPRTLPATVAESAAALRDGSVVAVFPEGTTWCGRSGGHFRPAMFQAAIDAGAPVVPLTLCFRLEDGSATTVAAFVGEDALLASLRRVMSVRGLHVELTIHPAIHPVAGASRRSLALAVHASVTGSPL